MTKSTKRGFNKDGTYGHLNKMIDVHITKKHRRERNGADDIHQESYGR
jgi:hypothetical protein